jgi:hypothetical protein
MFYRLRKAINYRRFQLRTRLIMRCPLACDPSAACAVHTTLCRDDLSLYMVAIKSFLRFCSSVAVVIHDDGTLDEASRRALEENIPGSRVIGAAEADQRAVRELGRNSFLFRWRAHDASYRRVIDTEIWKCTPRRIIMDADILCLRLPHQVIGWTGDGATPFLLGQPPVTQPPSQPNGSGGRKFIQNLFKENVPTLSQALGLPDRFLDGTTSGFYGCTSELGLEKLEGVVRKSLQIGLPMEDWGSEQCIVIYLLSTVGANRLDPERYINFDPSCVPMLSRVSMVHFYGTYRFYQNHYTRLAAQIASELAEPVAALA